MSIWVTQIRPGVFFFLKQGGGGKSGWVDLRGMESKCDQVHCRKVPNNKNMLGEKKEGVFRSSK